MMEGIEWDSEILDGMWKIINANVHSLYVEGHGAAFWVRTADVLNAMDWAADLLRSKMRKMEGKE